MFSSWPKMMSKWTSRLSTFPWRSKTETFSWLQIAMDVWRSSLSSRKTDIQSWTFLVQHCCPFGTNIAVHPLQHFSFTHERSGATQWAMSVLGWRWRSPLCFHNSLHLFTCFFAVAGMLLSWLQMCPENGCGIGTSIEVTDDRPANCGVTGNVLFNDHQALKLFKLLQHFLVVQTIWPPVAFFRSHDLLSGASWVNACLTMKNALFFDLLTGESNALVGKQLFCISPLMLTAANVKWLGTETLGDESKILIDWLAAQSAPLAAFALTSRDGHPHFFKWMKTSFVLKHVQSFHALGESAVECFFINARATQKLFAGFLNMSKCLVNSLFGTLAHWWLHAQDKAHNGKIAVQRRQSAFEMFRNAISQWFFAVAIAQSSNQIISGNIALIIIFPCLKVWWFKRLDVFVVTIVIFELNLNWVDQQRIRVEQIWIIENHWNSLWMI